MFSAEYCWKIILEDFWIVEKLKDSNGDLKFILLNSSTSARTPFAGNWFEMFL